MGRLVYRMCLAVVLMIAVAGGIYYFMAVTRDKENPEQGTFVDRRVYTIQKTTEHDSGEIVINPQERPA